MRKFWALHGGWWRENRTNALTGLAVFVLAALAFRFLRSSAGFWTIDDASITHAAAFEYADHGSRAMYPEGTPVESYSNPLVFFVVALLRKLGLFNPITTHIQLETLLFAAMSTLVWSLLRVWTNAVAALVGACVFIATELLTVATWVWYGSGLENVWVSTGIIVMLWMCSRSARGTLPSPSWGIALGLVALVRPESPVHVALGYLALFTLSRPRERPWRLHLLRVGLMTMVTSAMFIAFLAWRHVGYGDWLPNTYYAKIGDHSQLFLNLRVHVLGELTHYYDAGLFAGSIFVLFALARFRRLALCVAVLIAASLALPIMTGDDIWLGHHRFATAFFCMGHIAYALLLAVAIASPVTSARRTVVIAVALIPLALFATQPLTVTDTVWLSDVTAGRVAQLHGAQRWEQQWRLGVPFPVVMTPDAGGSLLVGAMQFVDDAYLADFQMGHMGKYRYGTAYGLAMMNQYEHEERRPDFVSPQQSGVLDMNFLAERYWPGAGYLHVRKDLIATDAPSSRPLVDNEQLSVYLSPRTVPFAAPHGLVRYELLVVWKQTPRDDEQVVIRASVGGDHDELVLRPYTETAHASRYGLLLAAPPLPALYDVAFELEQAGRITATGSLTTLQVVADPAIALPDIKRDPSTSERALRIAWLREQQVPRMLNREFQRLSARLLANHMTAHQVGGYILALRDNSALGALGDVAPSLLAAEDEVILQYLAECNGHSLATEHALCLGRHVDQLRRWGYLRVLERAPVTTWTLRGMREELPSLSIDERYRRLVALTLAEPMDMRLQHQLLEARMALAANNALLPLQPL